MSVFDELNKASDSFAENREKLQERKLRYLELAALMLGPQRPGEKETVQEFIDRYKHIANGIELNITGCLQA
jgi:hypothetical protein